MKIISGIFGGQSIIAKPNPKMRPTSDKVKEAIFDQLESKWVTSWEDLRVLDLFAGSGGLGMECLSRGAKHVVYVDHHLATVKTLKKSIESFEVLDRSEILCKGALDAIRWLDQRGDRFDLIFLDPPYREDWVLASLSALQNHPLLSKKGLVVAEHDKRELISPSQAVWKLEGSRRYGDTQVTLLTPAPL